MRRKVYLLIGLFLLVSELVACSSDQLPLTSIIDVQITQSGCHPMEWRAPAGQVMTIYLSNKAKKDYTWILMGRPATPPFDAGDAANIFFAQQVAAGASVSVQFHTPAAAGEYQVICSPPGHGAEEQSGRITIVQP